MLVYSTMLDIDESLTKEAFIRLAIEWNQNSPHSDSIISDINWNGERNIRYGNEDLWLAIEEYRNKNTIAIRYEKKEPDGVVWDTDFIMNFDEMRMAIQLDRSYVGEVYTQSKPYSSPYFLTLLANGGYLKDDNGLSISPEPLIITDDLIPILANLINGESHYRLPVVYVSKTYFDEEPVHVRKLAKLLRGSAHVFVQKGTFQNSEIRHKCDSRNEYHGAIGVYFTNSPAMNQRFLYRDVYRGSDILLTKVIRCVSQFNIAQKIPQLYTWQGVQNSLLYDRFKSQKTEKLAAEVARAKAEDAVKEYIDSFDEDLTYWKQKAAELARTNEALSAENQGLRGKLAESDFSPVLIMGDEDEFYPGEIKEMILSILKDSIDSLQPKSRRLDVVQDVIWANNYQGLSEKKAEQVKRLMKDYTGMSSRMRQELKDLGFEITEDGKHYKLTYYNDGRYTITLAKTPSDRRAGSNNAALIMKKVF